MDLQAKSWLEKAKRLHFSVSVTLRSDSSDEFNSDELTNSENRRFFVKGHFIMVKMSYRKKRILLLSIRT
jgi:hypothetical protein